MRILLICISTLFLFSAKAQTIDFSAPVSFTYEGEPLELALEDLSETYDLRFSYSRQLIPLDHRVYVEVDAEPLKEALDMLFEGTAVIYGFIGNQLVLSIDTHVRDSLERVIMISEPIASAEEFIPREMYSVRPVYTRSIHFSTETDVDGYDVISEEYVKYESNKLLAQAQQEADAFRAQISVIPRWQAISYPGSYEPVNLSFNVLAGRNHHLEGFELGTISNVIEGNMTGVQIGGVVNSVNMSSTGFQISGVVNHVGQDADGMQMSGVANISKYGGDLFQVGGVVNVTERSMAQIAGVTNVGDEVMGIQVGGVVNVANYVPAQVVGVVNVAEDVPGAQVSAFMNVAGFAGAQIGILNIADSSNFSLGILSFIKNGYRSLEIAGQETLHGNLTFRLGMRSFYNILNASSTYDVSSWAFGYGIGTSFAIPGRGNYVQLELISRHVSENESWTNELNLHNQFNILWDLRIGSHMSVAFGPTLNAFVSKRFVEDTNSYGSELPPYTILDETFTNSGNTPVNVKGWVGFHLGLRYNLTGSR